jgi:predicted kinase
MEAVVFCGVQGTGKSSFYRERFFDTHVRINLDMLRTRNRESILLRACLEAKQPFVVDNTNPAPEDRARYVLPARAAQFRVAGYYFQSRIDDALRRNAARPDHVRVPDRGIRGTYAALKHPSRQEGFDTLYYVRIGEDGAFIVEDWRDDL